MSDLYLILRRRLGDVAQSWAGIDGQVLIAARKQKGLSREALGALVGVVSKTIERYERRGQVPRQLLPRLAEALDLEIEEVPRPTVSVSRGDTGSATAEDQVAALRGELAEVREMVAELLGRSA